MFVAFDPLHSRTPVRESRLESAIDICLARTILGILNTQTTKRGSAKTTVTQDCPRYEAIRGEKKD